MRQRGGWGLALHRLWRKIIRRRTLLRRAASRTAKDESWLLISQKHSTLGIVINLQLGRGLARWRVWHGVNAHQDRAPRGHLLPLFGHLRLQVFGGGPFLPAGEETLDSPPRLSSFLETVIPLVRMCNV